ncbi:MAG: hypothetical protein ACJ8EB_06215 [Allosphingosinicella sp.]
MSLLCRIGGHEAASGETYNSGYWFSRCRRCRRDMLRAGGGWALVPPGHRVVWRAGAGDHSLATDFGHVLPIVHPAANLPMVRPPFASWSRSLVGRRAAATAGAGAEPEAAEREAKAPYPMLLVLATIVGTGLQCLFGVGR